jgi:hypothetical protein
MCVLIICLMIIEFLLFKAEAMDMELEPNPSPDRQIAPTKSGRQRKFPRHFKDYIPSLPTTLPHMPERPQVPAPVLHACSPTPPSPPPDLHQPVVIETEPDTFGLYRSYKTYPTHDPEEQRGIDDLCDAPGLATAPNPQSSRWWSGFGSIVKKNVENTYAPFLNATVFRLMH